MNETDIKLINEMIKNCRNKKKYYDEKAERKAITLENVLKELQLAKEALKDKCEIADERNQLLVENRKKDKIIDEMAKWLYEDDTWFGYGKFKEINTSEKIKQFFLKKVDEQE